MAQFDSIRFQPSRPLLKEVSADRLNAILSEIKKNRPRGERGITVRQAGDATYIGLASNAKGATTTKTTYPFQISSAQNPDNANQYLITVRPGTINSLLPANTFTSSALTQFTAQKDQLCYVILTGISDGKQFLSAVLSVESNAAEPQTPTIWGLPQEAQFLLGVVYNGSVFQIISDNITVAAVLAATSEKTTELEVGELPFNNFYVWGSPTNGAMP